MLRVAACCIIDIIQFRIWVLSDFWSSVLGALGNPSLLTILGSRMLFNLKEAAELGVNEGTNVRVTSRTMSAIDFAEPEDPQRFGFYLSVVASADYSKGKCNGICWRGLIRSRMLDMDEGTHAGCISTRASNK